MFLDSSISKATDAKERTWFEARSALNPSFLIYRDFLPELREIFFRIVTGNTLINSAQDGGYSPHVLRAMSPNAIASHLTPKAGLS